MLKIRIVSEGEIKTEWLNWAPRLLFQFDVKTAPRLRPIPTSWRSTSFRSAGEGTPGPYWLHDAEASEYFPYLIILRHATTGGLIAEAATGHFIAFA